MDSEHLLTLSGPTMMVYRAFNTPRRRSRYQERSRSISSVDRRHSCSHLGPQPAGRKPSSPSLPHAEKDSREEQYSDVPPKARQRSTELSASYTFVNASTPYHNLKPDVRKLVRSHVTRETRAKVGKAKPKEPANASDKAPREDYCGSTKTFHAIFQSESARSNLTKSPLSGGILSLLKTTAVDLPPRTRSLISLHVTDVASAIYPHDFILAYNPLQKLWFDCQLSDEMLIHAGLYMSTTYLGILQGKRVNEEAAIQMTCAIEQIRDRMKTQKMVDATLISAVSCLAISEALLNNRDKWNIHMRGVRHMIDLFGGMQALPIGIRMKLYRTDTIGAVAFLHAPHLQFPISSASETNYERQIHTSTPADPSSHAFRDTLLANGIPTGLISILLSLSAFSSTISHAFNHNTQKLDPMAFIYESSSIQRSLLLTDQKFSDADTDPPSSLLGEILRMAALLYIKLLLQEYPMASTTSRILDELRMHLRAYALPIAQEDPSLPLLVWCHVLPAMAHRWVHHPLQDEDEGYVNAAAERAWYLARLVKLSGVKRLRAWGDVEDLVGASGLPWCKEVLGKKGREVWGEVENIRTVMVES